MNRPPENSDQPRHLPSDQSEGRTLRPRPRWIAHIDMDSFYVSVERLFNAELIGRPVAVGGLGPRSVVCSASYEARKFGVRSAMPMGQARRLCPQLLVTPPQFNKYSEISRNVFGALEKIAPLVEQVSVDEAYLDFTGCERLYRDRQQSAQTVKETVKNVSGLTCTVAISTNKLVSKIGSDMAKPDGILIVPAGTEAAFLSPLSIRKIPGVGPKTAVTLERLGIMTCGQLSAYDTRFLKNNIGDYACDLQILARGEHFSAVDPQGERKSLSAEETFDVDQGDLTVLSEIIGRMAQDIATDLRDERIKARTVQVKMRYSDFTTLVRALTLEEPTHLSREIADVARDLLKENKNPQLKLRLLGVGVRNFVGVDEMFNQMNLFENPEKKKKEEKLEYIKDQLKKKFGKKILG